MSGKVIPVAKKHHKEFMVSYMGKDARIRTDKWNSYKGVDSIFPNLVHEKSEDNSKKFAQMHSPITLFKAWLRGIHRSVNHLQACINGFTYDFNQHPSKGEFAIKND